jgi:hypothetical protein
MFHYIEIKLLIQKALSPPSEFIAVAMNNIIDVGLSIANKIRMILLTGVASGDPGIFNSFSILGKYPSFGNVS